MKQIRLKQLKLMNFKGIREQVINFDNETFIHGRNGSGKTTIFDSFLWLFFGKDSTDRKNFEIKTLDENNEAFHKMTHEVSAVINVDGDEVTIRRTYKENWPTKKGTVTESFSGHTTNYYWNDVPMQLNEYEKKVGLILDESIFKLITNPYYFPSLKWQERREVLLQMAGNISNDDIFNLMPGVKISDALIQALNKGKSIAEFKAEISNKKILIKKEKDLLPSRIDEVKRGMPDFVDYAGIESMLLNATGALDDVNKLINDSSLLLKQKQGELNVKLQQLNDLKIKAQGLKNHEMNQVQQNKLNRENLINNDKADLARKQDELKRINIDIQNNENRKKGIEEQLQKLRETYTKRNVVVLVFDENQFKCPTCKRDYDAADADATRKTLTDNFNNGKAAELNRLNDEGVQLKNTAAEIEKSLLSLGNSKAAITSVIAGINEKIDNAIQENIRLSSNDETAFNDALAANQDYQYLINSIQELTTETEIPIDAGDNSELISKKNDLLFVVDEYKNQLATKDIREKQEKRITELEGMERTMAQELADYDSIEFSIDQFNTTKMNALESRINSKFKIVKFKMFEDQINGGKTDACTILFNGVPFSDANKAGQMNSGLDIISALTEYYQVKAPIFIDNRESVTEIPETGCQIINLIVSPKDKKLRISTSA